MRNVASFFLSLSVVKAGAVILQLLMVLSVNLNMAQSSSGKYLWLYSLFFVLSAFSRLGQDLLILKAGEGNRDGSYSVVIISSVLFSILSFFISYAYTTDIYASLCTALALMFNSIIVHRAHFLQCSGRYYLQVLSNNFLTNLLFCSIIFFIDFITEAWHAMLLYVFSQISSMLFISIYHKSLYITETLSFDLGLIVKGRYFCALSVTSFLINWFPPILVGVLLGDAMVSVVVILLRFGMVAAFPLVVVNSFFAGKLKNIKGGVLESFYFFKIVNKLSFSVSFIAVMIMTFSVDILFRNMAIEPIYKAMFFLIMLASFVNSLTGPVALYLNMLGEEKRVFLFSCLSFIIMVIVILILSESYSNYSVGIAILCQSIVSNIPLYLILLRKFRIAKVGSF
ncbi:MAG: O-antigen/teichoic acid export membrane protein [Marivirga sp.]|jgi:O-antigen/teichoic acid export membrane protein